MTTNKVNILFVDDEENILKSIKRVMIDFDDYACFFVNSGEKALEVMQNHTINVVISDMKMPVMNGLELMKIIKEKYPNTVKIILSGYAQLTQIIATVNQVDLYKFLLKPWKTEEFINTIEDAVNYSKLLANRSKEFIELEKKNVMYQKIIKLKVEEDIATKGDIEKIKFATTKFLKNINFIVESDFRDKTISAIGFFERLYLNYIDVFPNNDNSFRVSEIIEILNNNKVSLKINGSETEQRVNGNIFILKNIINEFINTGYEIMNRRQVNTNLEILEDGFKIEFILPFNAIFIDSTATGINAKTFPRYLDLLNDLLKTIDYKLVAKSTEEIVQITISSLTQSE